MLQAVRINHNIASLQAQNKLENKNNKSMSSMEKLSSGFRINRASDDAAGLSISEKMRGQIRGLEQARNNIQDGINLSIIADGGLEGVQQQLHRARELVIQAGNGTLTASDKQEIQKELDQIKEGINDIAHGTDFNGINLLNGQKPHHSSANDNQPRFNYENVLSLNVDAAGQLALKTGEGYPSTSDDDNKILIYGEGNTSHPAVLIDGTAHRLGPENVSTQTIHESGAYKTVFIVENVEVTQTAQIIEDKFEFDYSMKNLGSGDKEIGFYFHIDTKLGNDDWAPFKVNNEDITEEEAYNGADLPDSFTVYNNNGNQDIKAQGIISGDGIKVRPDEFRIGHYLDVAQPMAWIDTDEAVGDSGYALKWEERSVPGNDTFSVNTFYGISVPPTIEDPTEIVEEGPYDIKIQDGPNSVDQFRIQLSDVRTEKLGVEDMAVDPYEEIQRALESLDSAATLVSSERSKYGSYQNRLQFKQNYASNYQENLTAAESRIRDADMAKEIMNQTKNSILSQTSQAMLAQANNAPQAVLQLLK
ncbi:hypothetical protein GLW03_13345 [Halobacillus halophilus]|nr:hypothetical protein [Halobacillus halophilus]